jgi:hypothetical protein
VQLMARRAFALVTDEDYSDLAILVCGILKRQLRSCGQCRISEAATREGIFRSRYVRGQFSVSITRGRFTY